MRNLCGKLLLMLDADGVTKVDDLAKLENQVGVNSALCHNKVSYMLNVSSLLIRGRKFEPFNNEWVDMGYVLSEVPNGLKYGKLERIEPIGKQLFITNKSYVSTNGPDERSIPGNTVVVQADMPYSGLTNFGTAFLSNILHITFVDTPGVLSGEKQRTQRSYDFTGVTSWFAAKCDLILLLFDPHKLDISDEFKRVIASLRGNDDKIYVFLNKVDQVDTQQYNHNYNNHVYRAEKFSEGAEIINYWKKGFLEDEDVQDEYTISAASIKSSRVVDLTLPRIYFSNNSSAPHICFLMEDLKEEVEQEGYLQVPLMATYVWTHIRSESSLLTASIVAEMHEKCSERITYTLSRRKARRDEETNAVVAGLEVPKFLNFPLGFHGFLAAGDSKM
ncbi:EH domain-containing protein 1 [Tanacetum coccineum]